MLVNWSYKTTRIVCLQSICSFLDPRHFFFFSQPSVFNSFSYFHTLYWLYECQSLRVCGQGRGLLEVAHCFGKQCLSPPLSVDIGGRKQSSGLAAQSVEEVQTQLTFIMHSKCSCILLTKFPPQLNIGCRLFIVVWLAAWVSLRFFPSLRFLLWLCFKRDLMLR